MKTLTFICTLMFYYINLYCYKTIETLNNILLDYVLSTIVSNAFSDISPNRKDPLFIHLRIKYANPSKKDIYTNVAKSLSLIQDSLYKEKINEKTTMANIMGKIVIVIFPVPVLLASSVTRQVR